MKRAIVFVTWLVVFGSSSASAQENRNLLPLGEREAALANTGITSPTSAAVFYNPANLTRIRHPTVSMTGTTLLRFDVSVDALVVVDGVNQPFRSSGFVTIPASLASTYPIGKFTLATAILVPSATESENQVALDFDSFRATILSEERSDELWIGASLARPITDSVSAGLSAFAVSQRQSSFTVIELVDELDDALLSTSRLTTNALGGTAVAGLSWVASDRLVFGARVQVPLVRIRGQSEAYEATVDTLLGELDSQSETRDDFQRVMPWDLGFGVSLRASSSVELLADANASLPVRYRPLLHESSEESLQLALRASAAAEIALSTSSKLRLGLLYNGSASPTPKVEGDSKEDYYGATIGVSRRSGATETGLGAFFLRSRGKYLPLDGSGETVATRTHLLGGLLTVTYQL